MSRAIHGSLLLVLYLVVGCARVDEAKFSYVLKLASSFRDTNPETLPDLRLRFSEEVLALDKQELSSDEHHLLALLEQADMEWMIADSS